jgi:hypothetical protein
MTSNVTLWRLRDTIAVEKQYCILLCACVRARVRKGGCMGAGVCFRVCNLTYPAYKSHAPYCLRQLWLHHIFRHYLKEGKFQFSRHIFEEKSLIPNLIDIRSVGADLFQVDR